MSWFENCYRIVHNRAKDLPDTATESEIREHLRGAAWYGHQGTSWGKKAWGKAVRAYLKYRGFKPKQKRPESCELPLFETGIRNGK